MCNLKEIKKSKPKVEDYEHKPYGYINALQKYVDKLEKALFIPGQSEQLFCDDCGYEINPANICINMNCSTNENP